MTELAAPGATALLVAFAPARPVPPLRGMSQEEVTGLFGAAWELVEAEAVTGPGVPAPVRWVHPTVYRLIRKDAGGETATPTSRAVLGSPAQTSSDAGDVAAEPQ